MYLGRPMELAGQSALFSATAHPYTRALLAAMPSPDPDEAKKRRPVLAGEVPSGLNPPSGCVFHPRCPMAADTCVTTVPQWRDIGPAGQPHFVACHFAGEPGALPAVTEPSQNAPFGTI